MKHIAIVSRNLLDSSRITEALSESEATKKKYTSLAKFFEAEVADRALIDYYLVEKDEDMQKLIEYATSSATEVLVFGSHEKMNVLAKQELPINFVARSIFFRDPTKYI